MRCKGFDIYVLCLPPLAGTAEGGGTWRHVLHNEHNIIMIYMFSAWVVRIPRSKQLYEWTTMQKG